MPVPSQRKYDLQHLINVGKYEHQIRVAYLDIIKKIAELTKTLSLNGNDEFYFRSNSFINKKINKLLKQLYDLVYGITVMGANTEWDLAVEKNNEIAQYVFGMNIDELPKSFIDKYFTTNAGARRSFVSRRTNGLNLSDRVWRNTKQFKTELELALELALGKGKSASTIAKTIQGYLNEPDRLYRRVRDENGVLRLSKAAKAYNPGQGINRSSYKNALRLARNEINFSYEDSQQQKRSQQDFIVGVQIKVSPSHNASDDAGGICCLCLQGNYPKNFNWTYKWHVNCKCQSYNIIKTRAELDADNVLILEGNEPNTPSKNEVKKIPKKYNKYVSENKDKWKNWKNKPRFVVNN